MFCPNCGNQIPDGASFCSKCGTRVAAPQPQPAAAQPVRQPETAATPPVQQSQPAVTQPDRQPETVVTQPAQQPVRAAVQTPASQPKKKSKAPIIILITLFVIAAAAVALLFWKPWASGKDGGSGNTSIEGSDVAVSAVEAFLKMDADKIADLFPDEFYKALGDELDMTKKQAKNHFVGMIEDSAEDFLDSYPEDMTVKTTVVEEKSYSKKELSQIEDDYDELDVEIDGAKIVIVNVTVTADGKKSTAEGLEVPIVKIGKSWYLDASNIDAFLNGFEFKEDGSAGNKKDDDGDDGKTSSKIEGADVAVNTLNAFFKLDEALLGDLFPDEFYQALGDEMDMTKKQAKNYFVGAYMDAMADSGIDPDKMSLKITVTGEDSHSRSLTNEIKEAYGELDIEVEDAKVILVDMTVTYDGEKETYEDLEVPVVKIGGEWYLDAYLMEDLADQLS